MASMQALFDVSSYGYSMSSSRLTSHFDVNLKVYLNYQNLFTEVVFEGQTLNIVLHDITTNIQNIISDWYTLIFQKYMDIHTVII